MSKETMSWGGARVLVVEDNHLQARLIRKGLEDVGVQRITEAKDGALALALFELNPQLQFDLIICDRNMPNMNGDEFISQIRGGPYHYNGVIAGNSSLDGNEISGANAKDLMMSAGATVFYSKKEFIGKAAKNTLDQIATNHIPYIEPSMGALLVKSVSK